MTAAAIHRLVPVTTLLYLHGVGDDGTRRDWWDALLLAADSPLPGTQLIAPDFGDLITMDSALLPRVGHPRVTTSRATPEDRRRYRAAQAQRHADLVTAGSDATWPQRRRGFARVPGMIDAIGEKIVMGMIYEEVGRYVDEDRRRRAYLDRVLAQLPDSGPIVIIGHSLGALVSLEVIRHLPDRVHVPLLVTAASALARRNLPADLVTLNDEFPYDRVDGWINVYNTSDPVTRGLPIGMRFPQAIDVSITGGFADHALASCVADVGVASVIAASLHASPPVSSPETPSADELDLAHALSLVHLQLTWHMEQLIASDARTTVAQLTQFMMARRVVSEGAALRGDPDLDDWDRDHGEDLRSRVAERDLPAVLVRLAGLDAMAPLSLSVDPAIEAEAKNRVVADLGVPPAWFEVARRSRAEAAAVFRPLRRRGRAPAPPEWDDDSEPLDDADRLVAAGITASVRESLRPLAIGEAPASAVTAGLGDIRPACTELIARALTAHRVGTPAAGTVERTVLSRLLVLLGEQRVRVSKHAGGHERLRAQLRRRAATVAASLSWLARQGVGLQAVR